MFKNKYLCFFVVLMLLILGFATIPVSGADEDFTTYTEIDMEGTITVASQQITFAPIDQNVDSYVYKDYSADYFGDYDHYIDCKEGGGSSIHGSLLCVWGVTNTVDDFQAWSEGQYVMMVYSTGGIIKIYLRDRGNSNSDDWQSGSGDTRYYLRMERSGTTATCKIYSDSSYTTLEDTLTITCQTTTYRYIYGGGSRNLSSGNYDFYGYTYNLDIGIGEGWSNSNPLNSNPYPTNKTTDIDVSLSKLNITINDINSNQSMNITWKTNASGTWKTMQTNNTLSNGTYYCLNTTWLTDYGKTYYWSVNTSDNYTIKGWDNDTYYFTTELIQTSVNTITPYNQSNAVLNITASGNSDLSNVTLYFAYSNDNVTWSGYNFSYFNSITRLGYVLDNATLKMNYPNSLVIQNNKAYIVSYLENSLSIFNVTDKNNPSLLGDISGSGSPNYLGGSHDIVVVGDIAYISSYTDNRFVTLNISDPTSIVKLDDHALAGDGMYHIVDGDFAYVTTKASDFVYILNISNPSNITESSKFSPSGTNDPWHLYKINDMLYVNTQNTGVNIYNVSNPASAVYVNVWNNTKTVREIREYDNNGFNYIVGTDNSDLALLVWNITTNITHPTFKIKIDNNQSGAFDIEGNYVYVHRDTVLGSPPDDGGILVWNLTDLDNPTFEGGIWGDGSPNYLFNLHEIECDSPNTVYILGQDDDSFVIFNLSYNSAYHNKWVKWVNSSNPDTSYNWSWNFNFPNGTGYYRFCSGGMKSGSSNETLPYDSDTMCYYSVPSNNAPIQSDHTVWDGIIEKNLNASGVTIPPTCFNVTVNDIDSDLMNISVFNNKSGTWKLLNQTFSGMYNGTFHAYNTSFVTDYSTTYYLAFNISDNDVHVNETYKFTTVVNDYPVQSNHLLWCDLFNIEYSLNATDVSVYITSINVTVNDSDSDYMNITVLTNTSGTWKIVNQTSSGILNSTFVSTNVSWITNHTTKYYVSFNLTDGSFWVNETFNFTTKSSDCQCTDELTAILNELEKINKNLEGDDIIEIETTQFVIFILFALFCMFIWIGYSIPAMEGSKRVIHYMPFSGGLFVIFGAIDFISLAILISTNYSTGIIGGFLTIIGIILLLYGVMKAFYYE